MRITRPKLSPRIALAAVFASLSVLCPAASSTRRWNAHSSPTAGSSPLWTAGRPTASSFEFKLLVRLVRLLGPLGLMKPRFHGARLQGLVYLLLLAIVWIVFRFL